MRGLRVLRKQAIRAMSAALRFVRLSIITVVCLSLARFYKAMNIWFFLTRKVHFWRFTESEFHWSDTHVFASSCTMFQHFGSNFCSPEAKRLPLGEYYLVSIELDHAGYRNAKELIIVFSN